MHDNVTGFPGTVLRFDERNSQQRRRPDIHPNFRHLVFGPKNFPVQITGETEDFYETPEGRFSKVTRRKAGDPETRFVGPFTAEGDME